MRQFIREIQSVERETAQTMSVHHATKPLALAFLGNLIHLVDSTPYHDPLDSYLALLEER